MFTDYLICTLNLVTCAPDLVIHALSAVICVHMLANHLNNWIIKEFLDASVMVQAVSEMSRS